MSESEQPISILKRILVADDDPTSLQMVSSVLRKWDYEVIMVRDGQEALAAFKDPDAPSMAILDWMMPEMDGADVCRQVRLLKKYVPPYIILLTSLDKDRDIVEGLEAGADDYLTKPFNPKELRARLDVGWRVIDLQKALANRIQQLEKALNEVKTLQGIIPICMHCHKIRTDPESWQRLEMYMEEHSSAQFSHGLCPECLDKHYPAYDKKSSGDAGGSNEKS